MMFCAPLTSSLGWELYIDISITRPEIKQTIQFLNCFIKIQFWM